MQIINYSDFQEKLSTVMETISDSHDVVCLELPNSSKVILLSEEDYSSMMAIDDLKWWLNQ